MEPITFTFEEACSAVADLFEAVPETWTRHVVARTARGGSTSALSRDAAKWCAQGGLCAALGYSSPWSIPMGRLEHAAIEMGYLLGSADANNKGGRLVAIRMLRIAAGELPMPRNRP